MRKCEYCGAMLDAGEVCGCRMVRIVPDAEPITPAPEEKKPTSFSEKIRVLEKFFDANIGELKDEVTFESIYKEHWNKAEYSECRQYIELIIFKIKKELEIIDKMCKLFYEECRAKYFESYNLVDALQLEQALKEAKERRNG